MSASSEPVIPIVRGSTTTALASVFKIDLRFYSGGQPCSSALHDVPFSFGLLRFIENRICSTVFSVFRLLFYQHAVLSWVEFVSSFTDKQGRAFMQYAFCAWHAGFSFPPWRPPDVTVTEQTDFLMQGGREGGVSITGPKLSLFILGRVVASSLSPGMPSSLLWGDLHLRGFISEGLHLCRNCRG